MKKIYNSFAGFILFHICFKSIILLKRPSWIVAGEKKVSKKVGVGVVCVCFFIDFPLRQHGISLCFHLVLPNLTRISPVFLAARVFVSNYFSSPRTFSQTFLPLATTKNFLRLLPVSPEKLVFHITLQAPVGWGLDTQPRRESSLFMRILRARATQGRLYRKHSLSL